jgi:hypothetical protein
MHPAEFPAILELHPTAITSLGFCDPVLIDERNTANTARPNTIVSVEKMPTNILAVSLLFRSKISKWLFRQCIHHDLGLRICYNSTLCCASNAGRA